MKAEKVEKGKKSKIIVCISLGITMISAAIMWLLGRKPKVANDNDEQ